MRRRLTPRNSAVLRAVLTLALAASASATRTVQADGGDNLGSAFDISSALNAPPFTYTDPSQDTTSATREASEFGTCGNFPPSPSDNVHSVWYQYTPATNGWITVDTLGSNYDTVLEVYTGTAPVFAALASVGCNDDAGPGSQSEASVPVAAGTNYYIAARDYSTGLGGNLVFEASYSPQQVVYVNNVTGNDGNTGSRKLPVKTIQRGVTLVSASGVISITAGLYAENVTIDKSLTLTATAAVTATSFTLTNGAVLGSATGRVAAPLVGVNQVGAPGARIQDGVLLVSPGGTITVETGTYAENVAVGMSLTLQGVSGPVIQPAGGTALTLNGGGVTVNNFNIQGAAVGVLVTGGSGHVFFHNNITTTAGLVNSTGAGVTATHNWWGSSTGPAHASNPGAVGSSASDNVTFTPWCTVVAPTCTPLAGIATRLIFSTQPGNGSAGVPLSTQPVVRAQDAVGNLGINFNGPVSLTIGTNPPGNGILSGANPVTATNGVAAFSGLSIDKPGLGYTLVASGTLPSGVFTATSQAFDITNLAPTAVNDSYGLNEDSPTTNLFVLANDPDPNGDPTRILSLIPPANGSAVTVTVGMTEAVAYTPNLSFFGTDIFTYTMSDIYLSGVSTATVTVTVSPVNDQPSFVKGPNQAVLEDAPPQTVAGWATSVSPGPPNESGQSLSFVVTNTNPLLFSSPPTLTVSGPTTATLSYTPAPDANGTATVFVTVRDNGGTANGGQDTSPTQTFSITVTAVNDAPSFTGGPNQAVLEDSGPRTVPGWVTNLRPGPPTATDETGQTLTFLMSNTNPLLFSSQPVLTVSGPTTATLSFTPALNANGAATVTAQLSDNGGTANGGVDTSPPITFTITITPVNDAPTGVDDTPVVNEDSGATALTVLTNDRAANVDGVGEPITVTAHGPAANGVVAILGGGADLSYTPNLDFNGANAFTYTVTDGIFTATARVTVTVRAVNDPPSFTNGPNQSVLEDGGPQTAPGWATNMVPGPPTATDELTQTLTFLITTTNNSLFSALPAVNAATGNLTYTTAPNANGVVTVSLRLQDNGGTAFGGQDTSPTQTFVITLTAVNDEPSFGLSGSTLTVPEDMPAPSFPGWATSISPGPPDEIGQALTFTLTNTNNSLFSAQPALSAGGTLTLTLTPEANGSAQVFVTLRDNGGTANGGDDTSSTQSFTLTVLAINDAPVFVKGPDPITVVEDSGPYAATWATGLSPGPSDESGQVMSFTLTNNANSLFSAQPAITVSGTTGVLGFSPMADANGSALVTVVLRDSGGTANGGQDAFTQTVTITLTSVNDPPTANDDGPLSVLEDSGPNSFPAVLNNDSILPDAGETLTIVGVTQGANGSVAFTGSAVIYAPSLNYFGGDNFTYTVSDGGLTDTAVVSVTVIPVNDAPSFTKGPDDSVAEDSGPRLLAGWATNLSPGPNETGQTLTFVVTSTNLGLFSTLPAIDATAGNLSYTPAPNANGSATVFVALRDDGGTANGGADTSAFQTFVIAVTPVNDPPTANDDTFTVFMDSGANNLSVLANDTAAPDAGETLNITAVTQGANGSVAITGGGTGLSYTPSAGYTGSDNFTYTISDGSGGTDTAAVSVTIAQAALYRTYLPLVVRSGLPDLVVSFSLNPNSPAAGQPVVVTVVITNQGSSPAGSFWADFYINPSAPPATANVRWNSVCGLAPCYGIAWYVPVSLAPGQSVVLTSTPGGYCDDNPAPVNPQGYCDPHTIWPGAFAAGTTDLYLYVDSWNPPVSSGAVLESDETNNRFERHGLAVLGATAPTSDLRRPEDLPARP